MATNKATTLAKVIGARLRECREAFSLRQEDLARNAQALGLNWTRATIAAIEIGRRALSNEELAYLPDVAGAQEGWQLVADFMAPQPPVRVAIAPGVSRSSDDIAARFRGRPVTPSELPAAVSDANVHAWARRIRKGADDLDRHVHRIAEADYKAARRLGVHVLEVAAASKRLWNRLLTDERDARVAKEAGTNADRRKLQALRGHVTRALIAELQQTVKPERKKRKTGR